MRPRLVSLLGSLLLAGCAGVAQNAEVTRAATPPMAWDRQPEAARWTRAGMDAVATHGRALVATVPSDIGRYCPGYRRAEATERAAFWVGVLSALAKYESTWNARAIGGGGQWFGLTQISPATARGYGCRATSGQGLLNGSANISCAVRIGAEQVARDGAVAGDGRQGLGRDWAPFRDAQKRAAIAEFTAAQPYCS